MKDGGPAFPRSCHEGERGCRMAHAHPVPPLWAVIAALAERRGA